ncbi:unnamed protein product [Schistosoma curassoni]|uniref:Uncharacterized protein n=1 Tax=Schistosoma curassoni TaxID=6186 RepID=A0A183KVS0_9TREM|nr:unnamed protein product [Schistosoma curassoni]
MGFIDDIHTTCHVIEHFAADNNKLCNFDPARLSVSNDHSSLPRFRKVLFIFIGSYIPPLVHFM